MNASRQQAAIGLALLFLWEKAVELMTHLLMGVGLWFYLGVVKLPFIFAMRCVATDGRTCFALALALGLITAYVPLRSFLATPRIWRTRLSWLLPVVSLLGVFRVCSQACAYPPSASRFGFYPGFRPNQTQMVQGPAGSVLPECLVRVNSFGFRGREWRTTAAKGVRRVLLVGDSFVWGAGIQKEADMLDRQLERELNARGRERWEVLNIAASPAALWYYVNALIAVGREVRPDLYIMSFLGNYDLEPWEVQRVKTGLAPCVVAMMDHCGISKRLLRIGAEIGHRCSIKDKVDPETLADMHREFRKLVAFIDATDGRLLIWEPFMPNHFFDGYRRHPRITFVNWSNISGLPEGLRPDLHGEVRWQKDATLAFPGDGHPTPKGNALFAKIIAEKSFAALRRLASGPRAASATAY